MQTISISEDSEGRDDVVPNPETGLTELEQWVYNNFKPDLVYIKNGKVDSIHN